MKFKIAILALIVLLSAACLIPADGKTFKFDSVYDLKGADFWKDKKTAVFKWNNPMVPSQLPGPLDSWAGEGPKEIELALPNARNTGFLLLLYDTHQSEPPQIEIIANDKVIKTFKVKNGYGKPDWDWARHGIPSMYTLEIKASQLGSNPSIKIRSVSGSWMAINSIIIRQAPPSWMFWQDLPKPVAKIVFAISIVSLFILSCVAFFKSANWQSSLKTSMFYMISLVIIPVAMLAIVEVTLKIVDMADPNKGEDPYVGFQKYIKMYIDDPERPGMLMANQRRSNIIKYIEKEKPKNAYRVVFFGGSNVFKFQPELHLFEQRIEAKYPNIDVQAINFGVPGYGSHRVVPLIDEAASLGADLFVLYSGHNEFLEKRSFEKLLNEPPWLTTTKLFLQNFRLYTLMRNVFRKAKGTTVGFHTAKDKAEHEGGRLILHGSDVAVDWNKYTDKKFLFGTLAQYEGNVKRIAAKAGKLGVRLMVCTLSSSDLTLPRSPCYQQSTGPINSAKVRELMKRLSEYYKKNKSSFEKAMGRDDANKGVEDQLQEMHSIVNEAAALSPEDADVYYWQGFIKYFEGDHTTAKELLLKSAVNDCAPFRSTPLSNAALRRAAKSYELPLVDIEKLIDTKSPFGITYTDLQSADDDYSGGPVDANKPMRKGFGSNSHGGMFFDHCHLNFMGKAHALFAFADRIISEGWIDNGKSGN